MIVRVSSGMAHLLDSAKLDGPHAARISARPERIAVPLDASKQDALDKPLKWSVRFGVAQPTLSCR